MAKKDKNFTKNVSSWCTFSIYDMSVLKIYNNQCQYDIVKFQFYIMLTQLAHFAAQLFWGHQSGHTAGRFGKK